MLHLIRLINFTALRSSLFFYSIQNSILSAIFFSINLYFWSFFGGYIITPLRSNLMLHLIRSFYFTTPRIPLNYFSFWSLFGDLITLLNFLILFFLLFRCYSFSINLILHSIYLI